MYNLCRPANTRELSTIRDSSPWFDTLADMQIYAADRSAAVSKTSCPEKNRRIIHQIVLQSANSKTTRDKSASHTNLLKSSSGFIVSLF